LHVHTHTYGKRENKEKAENTFKVASTISRQWNEMVEAKEERGIRNERWEKERRKKKETKTGAQKIGGEKHRVRIGRWPLGEERTKRIENIWTVRSVCFLPFQILFHVFTFLYSSISLLEYSHYLGTPFFTTPEEISKPLFPPPAPLLIMRSLLLPHPPSPLVSASRPQP
jgi:hypothetical protein